MSDYITCPNCHRINPSTAIICDCGYDFETGTLKIVQKTSKPIIAGILGIIAGILYFIISYASWSYYASCGSSSERTEYTLICSLSGVSGVFAIVGGRYALKRKKWVLALIGTVFSLISGVGTIIYIHINSSGFHYSYALLLIVLGALFILPALLVLLSRKEFD